MNLFQLGDFKLHSGEQSNFKIDCDYLTQKDINCLAYLIAQKVIFHSVYGIPKGGERIANALWRYSKYARQMPIVLIVDDVFTTGKSMEEARSTFLNSIGAVIFARSKCPDWITPLFQLKS